jgi:transcriptional regulator with XRE-family HTH domain
MDQDGWEKRLTGVIAREMRRYRTERGLSAQKLADRCDQLGFPVPRSVIANLENGYRESVSVAELLILARALDIPPVLLVIPLGRERDAEVAPGVTTSAFVAAAWFSGQARSSAGPDVIWADDDDVLPLFFDHEHLVREWQDIRRGEKLMTADGEVIETAADRKRKVTAELRRHRSRMRKAGLVLPELPAALAGIDREGRSGGSR